MITYATASDAFDNVADSTWMKGRLETNIFTNMFNVQLLCMHVLH